MDVDYHALLPEFILSGTILLVLVVDVFLPERLKWFAMPIGLVGVVASLAAVLSLIGADDRVSFGGTYVVDEFALLFKGFFLVTAILVLGLSLRYFREGGFYQGEYYFLLLTSFLGCLMMPSSRDMLLLFIALELVSAPGFLMAAFRKGDVKSNEAGVKFFIIGVLSTAVMLFGMSLIYGVTGGKTQLAEIGVALGGLSGEMETLAFAAILFVVVGFAFKVSAFPFQFWAPDTYEGSPVPVAAFLAVASSVAGFAGLLQLMFVAFAGPVRVLGADLRVPVDRDDDRGQLRGAAADAGRAPARVLGHRAVGLHPADVRARHRRRGLEPLRVRRGRRLHPDLRHHEPRRVRRDRGGLAPAPHACGSPTSPGCARRRR